MYVVIFGRSLLIFTYIVRTLRICVRRGGFSLNHSARTPPAVHPGMTIWGLKGGLNLIFCVAEKGMQNFRIVGKPLLGEKYMDGKKKKKKEKEESTPPMGAREFRAHG